MENLINKNIKAGAGAIIIKDGKTLLAKRKGSHNEGNWGSLGGHIEFGETPQQATVREAKEELGIEIGNLEFRCCISEHFKEKQYIDVIFTADIISGEPKIFEPDKIVEIGWFEINNLPEPMFPPVKIAFEALRTGQKYYEFKE